MTKRALRKRMSLIDKFEASKPSPKHDRFSSRFGTNFFITAASADEVSEAESTHEDEVEEIVQPMWYVS